MLRRLSSRDDAGLSLIECIVALLIIGIVLFSGVVAIDVALTASNQQRYRVEATNLAVATLEQIQQEAAAGTINPVQTTYPAQTVGTQTFYVTTQFTVEEQNGGSVTSICTSTLNTAASQIWQVSASVSWLRMGGGRPLTETTEIAPGAANDQQLVDGELAIEVVGLTGLPLTTPVNFSVTPVAVGTETFYPGTPIPSGLNTGNDGCGIVTSLSVDPNWAYLVKLTPNSGWVSSTESSDGNPNGPPHAQLTVSTGQVTRLATPFQVALGAQTGITLQPVSYTCPATPVASCYVLPASSSYFTPDANLQVTAMNPALPNGQYSFGSGIAPVTTELLYPFSNGYSVFAGDMAQSNAGYVAPTPAGNTTQLYNGSPKPVTLSVVSQQPTSINVPVYDLGLTLTNPSAFTGDQLTATEQGGSSVVYTLNTPSASTGLSDTGMPLGQFLLGATGGGTAGLTAATAYYVWITPTGVYRSATLMTSPYTGTLVPIASNHLSVTEH